MPPITSEFYPPLDLDYLEDLLGLSRSYVLNLVAGNEIKTKKIGNKIFVSNYSLHAFMDKVPKDNKEMEKRIIKKKINSLREDMIIHSANIIEQMRRSNHNFYKRFYLQKKAEFSDRLSVTLNDRVDIDNEYKISFNIPYSEIKKIIIEVRRMNLWVFDIQIQE